MGPITMALYAMLFFIFIVKIIYGAFLYFRSAQKEKTLDASSGEDEIKEVKYGKALGKTFVLPGVFYFVGLSLMLLGDLWVWIGFVVMLAGIFLYLMMIRSVKKLSPINFGSK